LSDVSPTDRGMLSFCWDFWNDFRNLRHL